MADKLAYNARMDAEDIFDEAERKLSASLARQGAFKAIEAYDLREKSIRRAEAAARNRIVVFLQLEMPFAYAIFASVL